MIRPKHAYDVQKGHAKERGIKFQFSFQEWVKWWERHLGPDWLSKRGRRRGYYVMARNGDKGPYEISNVRCILYEDNCHEQALNGTGAHGHPHPSRKITPEQARMIYLAKGTQKSIADEHGISPRLVRLIKKKQSWAHTLKDL